MGHKTLSACGFPSQPVCVFFKHLHSPCTISKQKKSREREALTSTYAVTTEITQGLAHHISLEEERSDQSPFKSLSPCHAADSYGSCLHFVACTCVQTKNDDCCNTALCLRLTELQVCIDCSDWPLKADILEMVLAGT